MRRLQEVTGRLCRSLLDAGSADRLDPPVAKVLTKMLTLRTAERAPARGRVTVAACNAATGPTAGSLRSRNTASSRTAIRVSPVEWCRSSASFSAGIQTMDYGL